MKRYTFLVIVIFYFLPVKTMAQESKPPAELPKIVEPVKTHPLPGSLDIVTFFNSNSPELVQSEGILLSTFPLMVNPVPWHI